ncbi:MAG: 30S ribosomal protein S12 methylthiotransferase RimO [Candidatus Omnitrophota bacterium]
MKLAEKISQRQKNQFSKASPKHSSVGIINLGCARNLVDSQVILGRLKKNGHHLVEVEGADIAIVNTCSFIESAKQESVDVILDLIDLKNKGKLRKIIVAGCLAQRYAKQLADELPEVDAFVGAISIEKERNLPQVLLTPPHFAYVKICESCFNQCSFCAIPKIKGKFSSRKIESVLEEVKLLDAKGTKEVNIIGQDITAYGMDLYREKTLAKLLKQMTTAVQNIEWIRLLYAFPAHVSDELIDVMANEEKICRYIDMPLQHISDRILKDMNRNISKEETIRLIEKIKKKIPQGILRTTFIVGFPGETDEEFNELLKFVKEFRFERVGVFVYSKEEDTPAFDLRGQVPDKIKKERLDILMREQQKISKEVQESFIGRELDVLIDEKQRNDEGVYLGRSEYDAPDVDGIVYVHSQKKLQPGDLVHVRITDAFEYDLSGETVR